MIILSHPTGSSFVRQGLRALEEDGLLLEYVTFFATLQGNCFDKLVKFPGFSEFERRRLHARYRGKCIQKPWPELLRLVGQSLRVGFLVGHETGLYCPDRNNERLALFAARRLARNRSAVRGVYCFEDAALETFEQAKLLGVKTIYDLPIGYWRSARRILAEEAERRPEWKTTIPTLRDSQSKLDRKDQELLLADRIVVASTFTKESLTECPFLIGPLEVVPYAADDAISSVLSLKRLPYRAPLKAIFVGSLSQRKGIADLFDAVDLVGAQVQLTVIGRKPAEACAPLDSALGKHRWIESLPREKILSEMRAHDVFVFPSLFEGFGLVITEAMSQGLPVITTSHTCGPDVLTEGEDGFIVPIRDPQAIAEKLELLHRDRERLAAMSEAARKKAETLTWEAYRQRVVGVVREVLGEAKGGA